MPGLSTVALGASLSVVHAQVQRVTPVEKVVTLLENLKAEVESEGVAEAGTYDEFACFCKDTSASKTTAILNGRDNIESLSAEIGQKTSTKEEKSTELKKRQGDDERLKSELADEIARCQAAAAEYEARSADLNKAVSSLENAISAMESSKPPPAMLLAISESVKLANVLGLITPEKSKMVNSFLQTSVDPNDPVYKYHSQGIIDILTKLLGEFRAEKQEVDTEWAKEKKICQTTQASLQTGIDNNKLAMDGLIKDIDRLSGEIATARENLVTAVSTLKDDQSYMKDLTQVCESRAQDWDQRSTMRGDEIAALAGALKVLKDEVKGRDTDVNKRALLQSSNTKKVAPHQVAPSFVQEMMQVSSHTASSTEQQAVSLLKKEASRLQSSVLNSVALRIGADPFSKVKELIQRLVERLIAESTAEATKKGFCDTELGKAYKDRDFRKSDTNTLNAELKALELKRDELTAEIKLLTDQIAKLEQDLKQATDLRAIDKKENLATIKTSEEGRAAVEQAISILKVFYATAAKASLAQISPVDEDTSGPGFDGSYKGKQTASKGILGILEVIKTDFARTKRTTTEAEAKAHAEFVKFDRVSRADISGKSTKKELDEQDLVTTNNKIDQGMEDLQTAQNLLDDALKTVEDLKPTCLDTGMSYAERVAKREEEVEALRKALCILGGDASDGCGQGQGQGQR